MSHSPQHTAQQITRMASAMIPAMMKGSAVSRMLTLSVARASLQLHPSSPQQMNLAPETPASLLTRLVMWLMTSVLLQSSLGVNPCLERSQHSLILSADKYVTTPGATPPHSPLSSGNSSRPPGPLPRACPSQRPTCRRRRWGSYWPGFPVMTRFANKIRPKYG